MSNTHQSERDELFRDSNILFLSGEVNLSTISLLVQKLLVLNSKFAKEFTPREQRKVTLVINSLGGDVAQGLALLDLVKALPLTLTTVTLNAYSMAAVIATCGAEPGRRFITPYGKLMLHQPSLFSGTLTLSEAEIHLQQGQKARQQLAQMLADASFFTKDEILKEVFPKDSYFTSEDAITHGLVDAILTEEQALEVFNNG